MWYLFHKLEGARHAERGKAMHYNGTLRVTNRQKAEAFIAEYAKNSKLTLGKEDRWVKQKMNATLRFRDENDDVTSDFSLREMKAAIASTNPTKAAGPDGINPRLLRYLGEKCLRSLWLFSRSWNSVVVPQSAHTQKRNRPERSFIVPTNQPHIGSREGTETHGENQTQFLSREQKPVNGIPSRLQS